MNERTARSLLAQAITSDQPTIPPAELQTAANVLRHSPQFQTALRELAAGLESEAITPLPDWPVRLRAYIQAQIRGDADLREFRDVQQQLACSVELTAGYLALYDEMEEQQQRRRKQLELGIVALVGVPFLAVALRLFQQNRPELGLPLLALTLFGLAFAVAAQLTSRTLAQVLRQNFFGSSWRTATSTAIIVLLLFGTYVFQFNMNMKMNMNMNNHVAAEQMIVLETLVAVHEEMSSEIVSLPITAANVISEFGLPIADIPLATVSCNAVELLQPNQPIRQALDVHETSFYRVEIMDRVTLTVSVLAPSAKEPQGLTIHFYEGCIDDSLTNEIEFQPVYNESSELTDQQSGLVIPVTQQRFTLRRQEGQESLFLQLQNQHDAPPPLFYILSSTSE